MFLTGLNSECQPTTGPFHSLQQTKQCYKRTTPLCTLFKQITRLSQRDRAVGCISFGQKCKTGTGRQHFMNITGLSSTTEIIGLQSCRIRWKNANKCYYAVQGHRGRYQAKAGRWLPIIRLRSYRSLLFKFWTRLTQNFR